MINKSQQFAILGILFLLVSSCSNQQTTVLLVQPTAYPSAFVADYFPLAQGSYWVYEGNVKWQVNSDVFEKTMQWKMEGVDVVKRNDVIGFKMLGAPWDLEFYDDGKKPSEYSFIKVGSSRYYEGTVENYYRMMDENDLLRDLVTENDLFLDIPLVDGEKFCDAFSITRTDSLYCWLVGETQAKLSNVKGVDTTNSMTEFVISQYTGPDYSTYKFVPGIGITQFRYSHHGSPSEVDVKLIEYHSGK